MSKEPYATGRRKAFKNPGGLIREEHLVKAQLVSKIGTIMKKHRLNQTAAAGLLGIKQPDVSKMLRGEFRQFSVEAPVALPCGAQPGR